MLITPDQQKKCISLISYISASTSNKRSCNITGNNGFEGFAGIVMSLSCIILNTIDWGQDWAITLKRNTKETRNTSSKFAKLYFRAKRSLDMNPYKRNLVKIKITEKRQEILNTFIRAENPRSKNQDKYVHVT